jgi:cytochrome c oxidase subunit 1
MNAPVGYIHFGLTLVASCMFCWPVPYEGLAGMPGRYLDYSSWTNMDQFAGTNVFITRAIILLFCAQLLFIVNFLYSAVKGKKWMSLAND